MMYDDMIRDMHSTYYKYYAYITIIVYIYQYVSTYKICRLMIYYKIIWYNMISVYMINYPYISIIMPPTVSSVSLYPCLCS